jgi:hypothetical protein
MNPFKNFIDSVKEVAHNLIEFVKHPIRPAPTRKREAEKVRQRIAKERAKPTKRIAAPRAAPKPSAKVSRTVKPSNPQYRAVWDNLQDELDDKLSATGVRNFNRVQPKLQALYDIWSDPSEDDGIQSDAYSEFFDELADFGFSIADFDWSDFAEVYNDIQ